MNKPVTQKPGEAPGAEEGARYAIDPTWYTERSLSLGQLVRLRRCAECHASGFQTGGAKRRKAKASEAVGEPSWEREMRAIGECCSLKAGYITPLLPLMESVFRLLLANGNQPLTIQELQDGIRGRWAGLEYLRAFEPDTLQRLLERQQTYGIRPQKTEAPATVRAR